LRSSGKHEAGSKAGNSGTSVAPLILASRSPQRRAILKQLGIPFEVRPQDVDELAGGGDPEWVVLANARLKAFAAAAEGSRVLGVDTEVLIDGELLGKAFTEAEARAFLRRLSGRTHEVLSGLVLLEGEVERSGVAITHVTFRTLSEELLEWYLGTGEWRERAGAYAVQGHGAALVDGIEGDYWNVVGLPVPLLLDLAPELLPAGS
jgi:septum formation protein